MAKDRFHRKQGRGIRLLPVLGLLLVGGCADGAPPQAELAVARASLADAEQNGAVSGAPLQMQEARQRLAMAEQATRDEDYPRAQRLAEEADVAAKLAAVTNQVSQAEHTAQTVQQGVAALRQETQGPASGSSSGSSNPSGVPPVGVAGDKGGGP